MDNNISHLSCEKKKKISVNWLHTFVSGSYPQRHQHLERNTANSHSAFLWYSQQARYRRQSSPISHGLFEGQHQEQPSAVRTVSMAQCMHCGEAMAKTVLRHHMLQKHGDLMPYQCSLCGKGFLSHTGLSHHLMAHEGRKFVCPVCDSKFNQKPHLKYHLNKVHKVSQCPICSQTFDIGDEFNQHILKCG